MPLPGTTDLESLTGLRSGKRSYYREYLRSDERLTQAVRALDAISRGVIRTVEGPRSLLELVARAVHDHLDAEWTFLGLSDGHLPGALPRFVVVDGNGVVDTDATGLPESVQRDLGLLPAEAGTPASEPQGWVRVPLTVEGTTVGSIVARHRLPDGLEPGDHSVLHILANQAAVALYTSEQFQAGLALHRQARQLNEETAQQSLEIATRTQELRRVEERLRVASQRQLVDEERHRIARELHDTVTQQIIGLGMVVDVMARDAAQLPDAAELVEQLTLVRGLSQRAVDQLRQVIFALDRPWHDAVRTLPELLGELSGQHEGRLHVTLTVEGPEHPVPETVQHELIRAVGEALFNVQLHASASQVLIATRYRDDAVSVAVADDGTGDPARLRRRMRLAAQLPGDGRHRGLANIQERMAGLGGQVSVGRSRLGGVQLELRVPTTPAPG